MTLANEQETSEFKTSHHQATFKCIDNIERNPHNSNVMFYYSRNPESQAADECHETGDTTAATGIHYSAYLL